MTRWLLGACGRLEHRHPQVCAATSPLDVGGGLVVLQAGSPADALAYSTLLRRRRYDIVLMKVYPYPCQRTRVLAAIRGAGFEVDLTRRWLSKFRWQDTRLEVDPLD
jgi:hypothetical protein